MAMEFDKEMDALLKRMSAFGERPGGRAEPHLDAEEIAAFAENAVPGTARTNYITHFADCGRCRNILADTITLNAAEPAAAALPATASAGPAVTVTPWYKKLFALQSLAYGMAGMIVVFGGLIAYTALFSSRDAGTNVSQAPREENVAAAVAPEDPPVSMAESAANIAAPSQAGPEEKPGGPLTSALDQTERDIASARSQRGPSADRQDMRSAEPFSALEQQKESLPTGRGIRPAVAPSAPPPPSAMPTTTAESVVPEAAPTSTADAATREQLLARQQAANLSTNTQSQSGPSFRNERSRNVTGEAEDADRRMAAKRSAPRDDAASQRSVGGKQFELRDGVWFDSAYNGEATENIRRGTEGYRKLDSGLRSIAQRFREPVVTVWKGKAYRIQ